MWWIIIGAVIALIAVIVLLAIFADSSADASSGLSSCEGKGGLCVSGLCPKNTLKTASFSCTDDNFDCCLGAPVEYDATNNNCRNGVITANGKEWCA